MNAYSAPVEAWIAAGLYQRSEPAARERRAVPEFLASQGVTLDEAGSRLLKLIGDEVMFLASDPAWACDTAVALVDRPARQDALPPLRCGLAYGEVLTCDRDYYGPVVNLAARRGSCRAEPGRR